MATNPAAPDRRTPSEREPLDFRRLFAGLLVLVLAAIFFSMIAPFLEALFLAAIFSAMLYPIYRQIRRLCHREGIAALLTTLVGLVIIAVPLAFVVGAISREALRLTDVVGPLVEDQTTGEAIVDTLPDWFPFAEQLKPHRAVIIERAQALVDQAETFIVDTLSRATKGTLAFLLYCFVLIYAIFYFLINGPALLGVLSEHTPLAFKHQREIAERGVDVTRATLKSVLVIGALQGVLGGMALAVAGIDNAVFWGLVIAVASTIPVFGTALVLGPASIALLMRGDTTAGLGLATFSAIVVGGIDNLVRPYIVGHSTQLPDLLVLVSTLGGIAMFGATGIIVGPVLAGLFLTSLNIFVATFRTEFEAATAVPALIELPEGVKARDDAEDAKPADAVEDASVQTP